MRRWEYRTTPKHYTRLEELGEEGWELVTVAVDTHQTSNVTGQIVTDKEYLFKRPLPYEYKTVLFCMEEEIKQKRATDDDTCEKRLSEVLEWYEEAGWEVIRRTPFRGGFGDSSHWGECTVRLRR